MHRNRITFRALAVAGAAILLVAAAHAKVSAEFHKTVPLVSGSVAVKNINGSVKIAAWDRNEVQIDAVKTAETQQKLDEATIEVTTSPGRVEIETKYPSGEHHNPASVEYTIHVPRKANLDGIRLVNGSLDVTGLAGSVDAESVNGAVHIDGAVGSLRANSVNGRVDATITSLTGQPINLEAVNGALELRLPANASATIKAETVNGDVSTDFSLAVEHAQYGPGASLKGKLGDGNTSIHLNTVNGSIHISRI